MKAFGWLGRLRCGVLAALAGWLGGIVVTIPFEAATARQYVNGNMHQFPRVMAEGMLVWAAFTLLMALAAWVPFVFPLVLLIPSAWILRWRWFLIAVSPVLALLVMSERLNLFHPANFHSVSGFRAVYFTGPVVFAAAFALIMTWSYMGLVARRLRAGADST